MLFCTVICFPIELYGCLQGLLACGSLVVSCLNYAFTPWTQNTLNGNYTPVLLIYGCPLFLFYFAIYLLSTGKPSKPSAENEEMPEV